MDDSAASARGVGVGGLWSVGCQDDLLPQPDRHSLMRAPTSARARSVSGHWGHDRASVGYWVVPSARRRGVASALTCLFQWALDDLGPARLEFYVEPWNRGTVEPWNEGSLRAAVVAGYWSLTPCVVNL